MRFNVTNNLAIKRPTAVGATDFLRKDNKLASLLPAVERMAALQKDCAAVLPTMFQHTEILSFEQGQLVLAIPNTALAAKLKQQIPKLQDALSQRGWQVTGVKLKVQMMKPAEIKPEMRVFRLPETAVSAFDALGEALEPSAQNAPLIAALQALVARRKG
jgi:hypothetical protein